MKDISIGKIIFKVILFVMIFIMLFMRLTNIFERKDYNHIMLDGFYNLEENSQEVLFFGSSHVFRSINPNVLFDEYGIESYVLGTSEQPLQASYYLMVEALKTQSPEIVVVETFFVNLSEDLLQDPSKDSRIRHVTDPMRLSVNRFDAIETMTEHKDSSLPFHINFLEYHNRWKELTQNDFTYRKGEVYAEHRGYFYREESNPVSFNQFNIDDIEAVNIKPDSLEYLNKITLLAEDNRIDLILLSAPWMINEGSAAVQLSVENYAQENNLDYYDSIAKFDEYNFDLNTDFYDAGHLSNSGALKFTNVFGEYLLEILGKDIY